MSSYEPAYDVKIVASRQVKVYRDKKKDRNSQGEHVQDEKQENQESEESPIPSPSRYVEPELDGVRTNDNGMSNTTTLQLPPNIDPHLLYQLLRKIDVAHKSTQTEPDSDRKTSRSRGASLSPSRSPSPAPPKRSEEFKQEDTESQALNETFTFPESRKSRQRNRASNEGLSKKELTAQLKPIACQINERSMNKMLIEMRTKDRDRDRVIRPDQLKSYFQKHRIPVLDYLGDFIAIFDDKTFPGNINYEELVKYLSGIVENASRDNNSSNNQDTNYQKPTRKSTAKRERYKLETSARSRDDVSDRDDAKLILALEQTLLDSPNFKLDKFRSALLARDHYGNEQVSKQHVIQAASNTKLNISKSTLGMLLNTCDPNNRRIYNISQLVSYLERSQPHLLKMRSSHSAASLNSYN